MARLWTHRIFAGLSILWAGILPMRLLLAFATERQAGPERLGISLAAVVLFFPWIIVLILLVLTAVFTKPPKA